MFYLFAGHPSWASALLHINLIMQLTNLNQLLDDLRSSRGRIKALARSHLLVAVTSGGTRDVYRFFRLPQKCMGMSLRAAFLYSVFWCVISQTAFTRVLLQLAGRKRDVGGYGEGRGGWDKEVKGRGGESREKEYLWQSLSWVAERSVTYLMSIMHLCILCVLRREAHHTR